MKNDDWVNALLSGVFLLVVIVVVIAVVGWLSVTKEIAGQVVKVYTMPGFENGYARLHQQDGQDAVVQMSGLDYGLVEQGDLCTFTVDRHNWVQSLNCTPAKER